MNSWQLGDDVAAATVLANASIVVMDEALTGGLRIVDCRIDTIEPGESSVHGVIDLDGDFLISGLIDLHTGNLEKHYQPRKGVF